MSRVLRWLLAALAATALTACGGGTDGDAPVQVRPPPNALTITLATGEVDATAGEMRVHGVDGLFRTSTLQPGGLYVSKIDALAGPYAATLRLSSNVDGQSLYLGALATAAGPLNVTPLTTLAAAQLFGRDPQQMFGALGGTGEASLAQVTPEALAEAQVRVKAFLQRRHGYTVPASVGDFFTMPFTPQPGDPMFDAVTALNTLLAARGTDVFRVSTEVANEALLCNAERLQWTGPDGTRDFCPATKRTEADAGDARRLRHRFTDSEGNVLEVVVQGAQVRSVSLQPAGGAAVGCEGTACRGLALGAPADDGTRALVFTGLKLGAGVALDGTLQAAAPGAFFPPLPCANRYYVARPDGRVDAACAALDDVLSVGAGSAAALGTQRRAYTFRSDGSIEPAAPALEVVADPDAVVSVLVQDLDPDTGRPRTLWTCRGSACQGVTLGPVRDDPDSFAPYVLRQRLVTLDDTVLAALNPDGTPSDAGPVTVRATLDTLEIVFPPEQQAATLPCASAAQRVVVRISDESRATEECPPVADAIDGLQASDFLRTVAGADGSLTFHIASLRSLNGGLGAAPGLDIVVLDGKAAGARYEGIAGGRYGCDGAACSGVSVGAPDGAGRREIRVQGLRLREITTGGLPGDREAIVDGGFIAAAPG